MGDFRILEELRTYRLTLRFRRVLKALTYSGFLFSIPMIVAGVVDRRLPLRERTAFLCVAGCGALAMIVCIFRLVTALRQTITASTLARKVEREMPELMNSLVCACELVETGDVEHPLHHALLADLDARLPKDDLRAAVRKGEFPLSFFCGLLILVGLLMGIGHFMPLGYKARAYGRDLIAGTRSGIVVRPGNRDVAEMGDVRLEVDVLRGPIDDVWLQFVENGRVQRFRMTGVGGRRFEFDVFGVRESIEYQIQTSTLCSERYLLTVFKRPELKDLNIQVHSPQYTQLPSRTLEGGRSFSVAQNSEVIVSGQPNMPLSATLSIGDHALPFKADGAGVRAAFMAIDDGELSVSLRDERGHDVVLGPWTLTVTDDLPPLIKFLAPDQETKTMPPANKTPIVAEVSDDFGVGIIRLKVNRNGRGWKGRDVEGFASPGEVSVTVADSMLIEDAVVGDVLVYYLEVVDFAEPKPNVSRSGIRFIEIRPKRADDDDEDGKGEGGGKPPDESLSVADLIMRLKSLIRQTFVLDLHEPPKRGVELETLTGQSADLFLDANRRYQEIKKKAEEKNLSLGKIGDLFELSVDNLDHAYKLMQKSLPEEASGRHQSALSQLIQVEIELLKQMKKMKSKGKGKGEGKGKGKQAKSQKDKQQKNQQREQRKKLEELKETLNEINELIAREAGVRRQMKQLKGAPAGSRKAQVSHVGKMQRNISDTTAKLADRALKTLQESPQVSLDLKRALLQMQRAGREMDGNNPENAENSALRAETFLKRAKASVETMRKKLSGNQMDTIAAALDTLLEDQKALGASTRKQATTGNPTREDARELSDHQNELKGDFEGLLSQMSQAGEEMEEQSPGSAKAMERMIAQSETVRISGNMQRSSNALRYRKPGRAKGYQKAAEAGLTSMAASLGALRKRLGEPTSEQLAAMLEKMMETMKRLERERKGELSDDERRQLMGDLKKDASEMADRVGRSKLKELSGRLREIGAPSSGSRIPSEVSSLASQFCQVLEKELFNAYMKQKVKGTNVRTGDVPDTYRKLVDDYFKALADDRDVEEE